MRAFLLTLLLMLAAPALAQTAEIPFGFEGDDPIFVDADKATYNGGVTLLENNVTVRQGDTTVSSDRMEIYREASESNTISGSLRLGALRRIEALDNFRFENPENIITGDKGVYFADREIFIVTGNVVLVQPGGSTVEGNRLVYNLKNRSAKFGSECETGTASDPTQCERVTFTLE